MSRPETSSNEIPPLRTETPSRIESLDARRRVQPAGEAPARRRIPAEDLESIVRRASELQNRHGSAGTHSLTEAEVVDIGQQVGLEPDYVRRAIAEVYAESLVPKQPPGNALLDLLAGDARVEVRRVIAGNPARIQEQLEAELREREKLAPLRRRLGRSVWEASKGTFARLERFMNFSGREYALAEIRQVDLAVAELEPGWSLVTVTADLGNRRDESLYGAGGGVLAAAVAAFLLAGESAGAGVAIALLGAAAAAPWLRWSLGRRRARIAVLLEGLVDRAER